MGEIYVGHGTQWKDLDGNIVEFCDICNKRIYDFTQRDNHGEIIMKLCEKCYGVNRG